MFGIFVLALRNFQFKKGNKDRKLKNYGNKQGSKKQVGEWKQIKDEAQGLLHNCRMKINSKVFAIPILTASGL